jgi:hypothetical protein
MANITSQLNPNVVKTDLDSVFYQEWDYTKVTPGRATARTASLFKQEPWSLGAYQEEEMQGTGLFSETAETETFGQDSTKFTNKLTTSIRKFANGLPVSIEFFNDNMHGAWQNSVKNFATNGKKTQDSQAFALFRNAFTTQLTGDGVALISASHTLKSGGTTSNLVSGALSTTTLNDAFVKLQEQVDNNGILGMCEPSILLVPTKLFDLATRITKSELIQGSGNNDLNYFSNLYPGLQVMGSPWLGVAGGGSDTAWYLLADNHCITRLIREDMNTYLQHWGESDNAVYKYKAYFREAYKVMNYIGIVGATGT